MNKREFRFEWDKAKAAANVRKHRIGFDLAATVFRDPQLLTIADLEHVEEERWLSIGWASHGKILSVVYLWSESDPRATKIRLISARTATQAEIRR
ncbi:MAG TPA: BrnT family toxin [Bryobacteraceae bacterium]